MSTIKEIVDHYKFTEVAKISIAMAEETIHVATCHDHLCNRWFVNFVRYTTTARMLWQTLDMFQEKAKCSKSKQIVGSLMVEMMATQAHLISQLSTQSAGAVGVILTTLALYGFIHLEKDKPNEEEVKSLKLLEDITGMTKKQLLEGITEYYIDFKMPEWIKSDDISKEVQATNKLFHRVTLDPSVIQQTKDAMRGIISLSSSISAGYYTLVEKKEKRTKEDYARFRHRLEVIQGCFMNITSAKDIYLSITEPSKVQEMIAKRVDAYCKKLSKNDEVIIESLRSVADLIRLDMDTIKDDSDKLGGIMLQELTNATSVPTK